MFFGGWIDSFEMVSFVGKEHLYFKNQYKDFVWKLYRCDFQRNNVELLYTIPTYDGASNYIEIVCEEGNMLYFLEDDYGSVGGAALNSLKRLNMDTKKVEVISGDLNFSWCYYIGGELYYQPMNSVTIYKNSLAFDREQEFMEDYKIVNYNDIVSWIPSKAVHCKIAPSGFLLLRGQALQQFSQRGHLSRAILLILELLPAYQHCIL